MVLLAGFGLVGSLCAQQGTTAPSGSATIAPTPEFLATTDEVINEMSEITGWKLKTPLKRSIRTREEIHAYVLREMDDEKDAKERYASAKSAEAFGLIPKNFDLDHFMVDLLTEQIAGLYDPKQHEFYIADWIPPDEQRMVMSHELTHALQDQYFQIEAWTKAAKPNDDAELARESVLEGSAMAGMLEYELRDKGLKLRELPDIDPAAFVGDLSDTPMLKKAPLFIKDSLMFPYFSGLRFSMAILRAGGWGGFDAVFAKPPANTQQIMHPELYREGKTAAPIKVDLPDGIPGKEWTKLEEDSLGEFGWEEVLKQFGGAEHAAKVTEAWDGDDYATYERRDKLLMLFTRTRFDGAGAAGEFFRAYKDALAKKYSKSSLTSDGLNDLRFTSANGEVFFRCEGKECVTLEGGTEEIFLKWVRNLGWPAGTKSARAGVEAPAWNLTFTMSGAGPSESNRLIAW